MKPHVIMHMVSSLDGRILGQTWPTWSKLMEVYEAVHRELKGDAWIVGRVTMAEFSKGGPQPISATEVFPRTTWRAPGAEQGPYAIALDQDGKLHLNISTANGDAIVVVLTKSVPDNHLTELRRDNISYIFAGETKIDLGAALAILHQEFGIKRLLLEGGGGVNGSFLSAGLIDELSVLIAPLADGTEGPTIFTRDVAPAEPLALVSMERLDSDLIHLRYEVER